MVFCDWLLSLSIMFSRFINIMACINISFLFYKFIHFILFLAALGLRCCAWVFSSCGEWGLLFVVRWLLIAVVSLVAEHGL